MLFSRNLKHLELRNFGEFGKDGARQILKIRLIFSEHLEYGITIYETNIKCKFGNMGINIYCHVIWSRTFQIHLVFWFFGCGMGLGWGIPRISNAQCTSDPSRPAHQPWTSSVSFPRLLRDHGMLTNPYGVEQDEHAKSSKTRGRATYAKHALDCWEICEGELLGFPGNTMFACARCVRFVFLGIACDDFFDAFGRAPGARGGLPLRLQILHIRFQLKSFPPIP